MKKPYKITTVTIIEWYEELKDGVYLVWKLPNGEEIRRLTPYDKSPWRPYRLPMNKS